MRRPNLVYHADWSEDENKRWASKAVLNDAGQYAASAPNRQSLRLRRFLRFLSTEAPLLDRHYPASLLVRASPPPYAARPDSHEVPVGYDHNHH